MDRASVERRRSRSVSAPLLAAAAASLMTTGCRQAPEMQRCVDEQNRVVAESFCLQNGVAPQPLNGGYGGGGGYFPTYRYYYGGTGGWNTGETVTGGSYTRMTGHSYTTSSGAAHSISEGGHVSSAGHSSGTSRGGFGSSHGGGS